MSLMIGRLGAGYSIPYSYGPAMGIGRVSGTDPAQESGPIKNVGESTIKEAGRKSSPAECQTCAERKYKDGSDESDHPVRSDFDMLDLNRRKKHDGQRQQ